MRIPTWIGYIVAVTLGLGLGFFLVLNVLFSDVSSTVERVQAVAMVLGTYAVISFLLARLWPSHRRSWVLWLIVPPGIFATLYLVGEQLFNWYTSAVFLAFIGGSLLGAGYLWSPRSKPPAA